MAHLCSIDSCGKKLFVKKLCSSHYYRLKTYGDPEKSVDLEKRLEDRFLSSFVKNDSGCFAWVKSKDRYGYGKISFLRKSLQAHRFSFEYFFKQKIPKGMVVMHKCNNKGCVNPDHLKLGTVQEKCCSCGTD